MIFMKKVYILFVVISHCVFAQVGIGTVNPKALLDIEASNPLAPLSTDGILIPRINNFPVTNPTADQNGMLVFLTQQVGVNRPNFYYWDHPHLKWEEIGNSLDEAYDQDGLGVGRTITADTGAVLIQGTDGLQVTGIFGSGATLNLAGAGTKMFFYPRKAALRAGGVSGSQWDDVNIGNYSTAFGYNTIASGENSFASGFESIASGLNSTALGKSTATGENATAIGENATATGLNSIGLNGNATADGAIAILGNSSGINSIAINSDVTVDNAIAIGGTVTAASAIAFAGAANGVGSIGIGGTALGDGAIAFRDTAYSFNEISLGEWGTPYTPASTTAFVETDRLFRIGNGYKLTPGSPTIFQDAMVILKNGNVGFSESNPLVNLHINGGMALLPDTTVIVSSDNQVVPVGNRSSIFFDSNATPTLRTITLGDGVTVGQLLIITCTNTDPTLGIEVLDATINTNLQGNRILNTEDTLSLIWNGTKWIETHFSNN